MAPSVTRDECKGYTNRSLYSYSLQISANLTLYKQKIKNKQTIIFQFNFPCTVFEDTPSLKLTAARLFYFVLCCLFV